MAKASDPGVPFRRLTKASLRYIEAVSQKEKRSLRDAAEQLLYRGYWDWRAHLQVTAHLAAKKVAK